MKKILLALAIRSLIVFALVTTVMADNGPHGSFAADTGRYGIQPELLMINRVAISCNNPGKKAFYRQGAEPPS